MGPKVSFSTPRHLETPDHMTLYNREKNSPLQRVDGLQHNISPHAQNVHPHFLHLLCLTYSANVGGGALAGGEFPHAGRLETHFGVFSPGVGAGADGENGGFACGQGGVRDCED